MRIYIFVKYLEVTQGILVCGYFSYEMWPLAQVIHASLCWLFFHGNQNLEFGSLPVGLNPDHNNLGGGREKRVVRKLDLKCIAMKWQVEDRGVE